MGALQLHGLANRLVGFAREDGETADRREERAQSDRPRGPWDRGMERSPQISSSLPKIVEEVDLRGLPCMGSKRVEESVLPLGRG